MRRRGVEEAIEEATEEEEGAKEGTEEKEKEHDENHEKNGKHKKKRQREAGQSGTEMVGMKLMAVDEAIVEETRIPKERIRRE